MLALYVSGFACATTGPLAPGDEKPAPHIALLLPLKSTVFGSAAEAVQQGFLAAAGVEITNPQSLPVRVYGCFDENNDIVALYRQAVARGALAVVGPLTRSGVSALAAEPDIPVPTLTLNVTEDQAAPRLYYFGMAAEAEARRVAQLAAQQGFHQAVVIAARTQLAQRLQFAFEEAWQASGGKVVREIEFNDDPAPLADLAATPDTAVFLATDAEKARLIRPYLPNKLPTYATSQIFVGNHETLVNYDLNGIRFVDMPWLLQPDHPAVMIYPRANPPLPIDHERLYALGIDAFRLIQALLSGKLDDVLPLDGVSGHIQLDGHIFQRVAIPAVLRQGRAQLPDAPVAPSAPMFPDLVATPPSPEAAPPQ